MANSLQEQLLKAGLVSEEQLRKATQPRPTRPKGGNKRRKRPNRGSGAAPAKPAPAAPPPGPTLEELNARIRGLLDAHRQNTEVAEVPYNFMRENRIKKLYVTEEQRQKLLAGELAIAGYRRIHHVIPSTVAEEILALRSEIFVHRANDADDPASTAAAAGADDTTDVPDDLVW